MNNLLPGFWNTHALSIVASRIYALFVAKSTSVPGLGGGGVKPILAMPGFWQRLALQPLPKESHKLDTIQQSSCGGVTTRHLDHHLYHHFDHRLYHRLALQSAATQWLSREVCSPSPAPRSGQKTSIIRKYLFRFQQIMFNKKLTTLHGGLLCLSVAQIQLGGNILADCPAMSFVFVC